MNRTEQVEELTARVEVLERKLDIAIRTIGLIAGTARPGLEWMDAGLAKVEDPRQIGVST